MVTRSMASSLWRRVPAEVRSPSVSPASSLEPQRISCTVRERCCWRDVRGAGRAVSPRAVSTTAAARRSRAARHHTRTAAVLPRLPKRMAYSRSSTSAPSTSCHGEAVGENVSRSSDSRREAVQNHTGRGRRA